jgi:hypothetical protein
MACERAIEIDNMEMIKTQSEKGRGLLRWIVIKGCGLIHPAMKQSNALTVFQINGGEQDHDVEFPSEVRAVVLLIRAASSGNSQEFSGR